MKRAIITGATGAVGTALVQELIDHEIEVLVFCRGNSKRAQQIPKSPLVTIKDCALEQLAEAENDQGKQYDVFYHFAWQGTTGVDRNDMYLQNQNVKYALDAVAAAQRFGCDTFIGAGSQAEYGRFEGKLTPDTPVHPENGYGIAKLCAGQMTREYAHQLSMKHIWTRILSVYGPCDGMQSMVMSTISQLLGGTRPKLTQGVQMWDYLYSKDVAGMLYALAEKGRDGQTYCLGSGQARPLLEYVNAIKDACGWKDDLVFGEIPYSEKQVMYLCADTTELVKDTGYQCRYTFEEGIKETVRWYREKNQ